jgi:Trypsin-like peptidase domain
VVAPTGLVADQVVEVITPPSPGQEEYRYGTGYRIGERLVLTARHLVDAEHATVRFGWQQPDSTLEVPARVAWRGLAVDVALLELEWPANAPELEVTAPVLGDVPFAPRALPFQAVGFPAHKARERDGPPTLRDSDQVIGQIPALANAKTGYLDLHRDGRPLTLGAEWRGMSGAAVFVHDLLIGVLVQAERGGPLVAHRVAVPAGAYTPAVARHREPEQSVAEFRELLAADGLDLGVQPARRRPAYMAEIEALAAGVRLRDRSAELAELAAFAMAERPYACAWWQADPWAGKTALAAHFATDPPTGVDVVAFFISRARGQQTAAYFAAVTDQLASILEEPAPVFPEMSFTDLWTRAGRVCEQAGRRLLLLIDGLDENDDPTPIAARLPADGGPVLRVALLSRPHPDVPRGVSFGHPIRDLARCPRLPLTPSPYARNLEQRARAELSDLLEGDLATRRVLSLLAATGPLTATEASAVLQLEGSDIEALDVRRIAGRAAARILRPMTVDRERYAFQHDTLREVTVQEVSAHTISVHRDAIKVWADRYEVAGWPDDTPDYLLLEYPTLLVATDDVSRLARLTSPDRIAQLQLRTGDDSAAVNELNLALHQLVSAQPPDLPAACKLAVRRENLKALLLHSPVELIRAHAALGQFQSAYRLAQLLDHPEARDAAFAIVTSMASQARQWDTACPAAMAIQDSVQRATTLAALVEAAANDLPTPAVDDLLAQARHAAITIDNEVYRPDALAAVARAAAAAGRGDQAGDVLLQAEHAAASIDSMGLRSLALAEVAEAAATIGRPERVEGLLEQATAAAAATDRGWERAFALATIAQASAASGHIELASDLLAKVSDAGGSAEDARMRDLTLAEMANAATTAKQWDIATTAADAIEEPLRRARVLILIARGAATAGRSDLQHDLLHRAGDVAAAIEDSAGRAHALADTAEAAASAGRPEFVIDLLSQADQAAMMTIDPLLAARALATVAYVAGVVGETARATKLLAEARYAAAWIDEMAWRDFALTSLAEAATTVGQWDMAAKAGAMVENPGECAVALARVAQAAAEKGERRTDLLDRAAEALQFADADPFGRPRALVALVRAADAAGRSEQAAEWLREAGDTAATFKDPIARVMVLTMIARTADATGRIDEMTALLTQAEPAANAIEDPDQRAAALAAIADVTAGEEAEQPPEQLMPVGDAGGSEREAVAALLAKLADDFDPRLCGLAARLDIGVIPALLDELSYVPPGGRHRHHWLRTL